MTDAVSFHEAALRPLLDRVSEGIAVAAPGSWRLVYFNSALAELFDRPAGELHGMPLQELFDSDMRSLALEQAERVCDGAMEHASIANVELFPVAVEGGTLLGVVVRAGPRAEARPLASRRDPLTGLHDREFLMQRLAALLRGEQAADRQFAVLFIDLDNFKQVNDAHGHLVGDRVLKEMARRLVGCVRDGDCVVRFGGDEFVVLLERARQEDEAESVVQRIQDALEKPIAVPDGEFRLTLSIGMALAGPEHRTPEDVVREADRAMYAAKRRAD